jgi:hypothetical protein
MGGIQLGRSVKRGWRSLRNWGLGWKRRVIGRSFAMGFGMDLVGVLLV